MASLTSKELLKKLAHIDRKRVEMFSKREIAAKINEIKYLSAQKKVPRLSLRKEIIHLEHQLQGIFDMETKLLKKEQEESTKVTALKKQLEQLRQKVSTDEERDLQKKVERLSHLLGEYMAQTKTLQDVELSRRIVAELQVPPRVRKQLVEHLLPEHKPKQMDKSTWMRLSVLQHRLSALRQELEIKKHVEDVNPEQLKEMEQKIAFMEQKIKEVLQKGDYTLVSEQDVKHTILLKHDFPPPQPALGSPHAAHKQPPLGQLMSKYGSVSVSPAASPGLSGSSASTAASGILPPTTSSPLPPPPQPRYTAQKSVLPPPPKPKYK